MQKIQRLFYSHETRIQTFSPHKRLEVIPCILGIHLNQLLPTVAWSTYNRFFRSFF